ncbi:MAG: hypothetical protein M3R62_06345 [Acidobacteriota bacterium]|nr:hypothetical protein [Acidobacteriota bacterium]
MSIRIRTLLVVAGVALGAVPALAQSWGAGASLGLVEDVSHRFSLDELRSRDLSAWVEFHLQEQVQLRGTFGSLRTRGANSGRIVTASDGALLVAPDLKSRVDYGTVGVSYEFWEGDYTSGIFAGIGGYRIRPESAPAGFSEFSDPRETVLGWHAGVDGAFKILRPLSAVGRITVHGFRSGGNRTILTAGVGLLYRF